MCRLMEALSGCVPSEMDDKSWFYLERHHADLIRDSWFSFLRTQSLDAMLSATCPFCRTVFGCCRGPVRGHNNRQDLSAWRILCSDSCAGPLSRPPGGAAEHKYTSPVVKRSNCAEKKNQKTVADQNIWSWTKGDQNSKMNKLLWLYDIFMNKKQHSPSIRFTNYLLSDRIHDYSEESLNLLSNDGLRKVAKVPKVSKHTC